MNAPNPPTAWWRRARWPLLIVGIALAAGYALVRGPMRAMERLVDFPTFYTAGRAWLAGKNPYDPRLIQSLFEAAGGDAQTVLLSVNPPGLFPLISPLSALPYGAAKPAMIGLSLAAFAAALVLLARVAGIAQDRFRIALLVFGALMLAPLHTSISQGQLTLFVVLGLAIALWAELNQKDVLLGVALAVCASLKPQMVFWFAPYFLFQQRWRLCAAGLATTFGILGLGVGRMAIAGVDWLPAMMANLDALTNATEIKPDATGTGNIPNLGSGRYIITSLAPLLYEFTDQRWIVQTLTWLPAAAVGLLFARTMPRRTTTPHQTLCVFCVLSLLSLLTLYNRVYCLVVLVLVLVLVLSDTRAMLGRWRWVLLALLTPLIVPGPAIMSKLESTGRVSESLAQGWAWQHLLLPHQIYLQLALLAVLLVVARRRALRS